MFYTAVFLVVVPAMFSSLLLQSFEWSSSRENSAVSVKGCFNSEQKELRE
ncbi:MAG: hypothetical protein HPY68_00575 [Candidatus Atribacteria bacterium]|nr:hypothetical protein [Candidatus Atribacteria bacterium]